MLFHRGDFIVAEAKCLEIREGPVCFAKRRIVLDAVTIDIDGFVLPADRFQRMAEAGHAAGMVGLLLQSRFIGLDAVFEAPHFVVNAAKH